MDNIQFIEEINAGGFGKIDKVRLEDGTICARKTFSPAITNLSSEQREKFRLRFIREVRTQKKLSQDMFLPVLADDITSANPWFLMPLAEKTFQEEIETCRKSGNHPEGLSDILNCLEYLHDLGFVHRDLKPANVLYEDGKWKLSDLGLITADKEILSMSITSSDGLGLGTVLYCAPEQVNEFKRVTHEADIYSFGAILHDIYNGHGRRPYGKLKAKGSIGFIIEKCTEEDPQKRFSDVSSLRSALLGVLAKENTNVPENVGGWFVRLEEVNTWKHEDIEAFLFLLKSLERSDKDQLLKEIGSETILALYKVNPVLWEDFAINYSRWVGSESFEFNYCDVLIGRLRAIYDQSLTVEVKCEAVLAAINLGASHNRWYVMGKAVKMSDGDIDDNLAMRIAIEISVQGSRLEDNFFKSVDRINRSINQYHPEIQKVLRT